MTISQRQWAEVFLQRSPSTKGGEAGARDYCSVPMDSVSDEVEMLVQNFKGQQDKLDQLFNIFAKGRVEPALMDTLTPDDRGENVLRMQKRPSPSQSTLNGFRREDSSDVREGPR